MNFSVPYSWLKEYVPGLVAPKKLAERVSLSGASIDRVRLEGAESILEAEVTTNRPDANAMIGFAREVAAMVGKRFKDFPSDANIRAAFLKIKKRALANQKKEKRKQYSLSIKITDPTCRRYCGIILDHISVKPSPDWMQKRLIQCGLRPINNVVDITNYVMLEIGQPLHAFDADLLVSSDKKDGIQLFAKEIIVRKAVKGEHMKTLDGEEKNLDSSMLVIADTQSPLAIAGIKGGQRAGITQGTNTVVLESASFDPISVRKTSRVLDLRTDSSARYEKGLSPEYSSRAVLRAIKLLEEYADGVVVTPVIDAYPSPEKSVSITFDPREIKRIIGIDVSVEKITKILRSLGFFVRGKNSILHITPPFWRRGDCIGSHDLVEEVGRMYGYDKVPSRLLSDEIPRIDTSSIFEWERKTKRILRDHGWHEIMTYSCVGAPLIEKGGFLSSDATPIHNPLSSEFAFLRPSLLPGLLETASLNEQKCDELFLFELSKVYTPTTSRTLPKERRMLSGLVMKRVKDTDLFREVKGHLALVFKEWFGTDAKRLQYKLLDTDHIFWQKGKAAQITYDTREIGLVGIPHEHIVRQCGIKTSLICFDLEFESILSIFRPDVQFTPLARYPAVVRDIAFVVPTHIPYQAIADALSKFDPLIQNIELFDVFESEKLGKGKRSLALHVTYLSRERTLHAEEVDTIHTRLTAFVQEQFSASIR